MKCLVAITFTLVVFAACQKAPVLSISSPSNVELSADGSSASITFTANRNWRATCSDSWVTISPSSGIASDSPVSIAVRCDANTTYDDRTASVTISMEELSQTVAVRQPANLGVIVATKSFNLASNYNAIEIEVQANVQYSVSTSVDWIKQTGTKGLVSNILSFSIGENESYDAREGMITIKAHDGSIREQIISVKQAQKDVLNIKETSYKVPCEGGVVEIKVEANVDIDVKPNVDWIHFVETKALNNSTICLKLDENSANRTREGLVEIAQRNGSLTHVVTIVQSGYYSAIDLGIILTREDGSKYKLYWAECNVGASIPEEFGGYYAWGEVETKGVFYWETYKFRMSGISSYDISLSKYNSIESIGPVDNKIILDLEDDVAHVVLGGKWRMPTREELDALINQCDWTWTSKNGVNGQLVTSRVNSNSIFLPAAGYKHGPTVFGAGMTGSFWSSSLGESPAGADNIDFNSGGAFLSRVIRSEGFSIRPVTDCK